MKLDNKVAIITGSSTEGIGFNVAKGFLKNGAKVVLCGVTNEEVDDAVKRMGLEFPNTDFIGVKVNVTNTNDVENLFATTIKKFGKVDILVNNAGIAPQKKLEEMTDEDFYNCININLFGTFRCTREAVKYMKENGGSIINTSSFVSLYGSPSQAHYTASKAGINGLTKSNAKELGKYKIRVNAVAPGVVMTKMVKDNVSKEQLDILNAMTPIGRPANPEDLVGLYVYLASDESLVTTGTIINVDGGLVY